MTIKVKSTLVILPEDRKLFNRLGWCNAVPEILEGEAASGLFCHSDTGEIYIPEEVPVPILNEDYVVDADKAGKFDIANCDGSLGVCGEHSSHAEMFHAFFNKCTGKYTGSLYLKETEGTGGDRTSTTTTLEIVDNVMVKGKSDAFWGGYDADDLKTPVPNNSYQRYMKKPIEILFIENIDRWDELSDAFTHS